MIALTGTNCVPFGGVFPPIPILNPGPDSGSSSPTTNPNGCFDGAVPVQLDAGGNATIEETVGSSSEVDVYDLGPLSAGDRIRVDAINTGGSLDPQIALFDSECRLYIENDDIILGIELDSRFDQVLRRSSDVFYLAIGSSTFGVTTGSYRATIQITRGGVPPVPTRQTVLLNFAGGSVRITDFGTEAFDPFDGGDIDALYAGSTTEIIDSIVDTVRQNFARFNVDVLRRDPGQSAPGGVAATVNFGGFSAGLFGIADDVDIFNAAPVDDAIVFTQQFTPDVFTTTPSAAELGTAIGNIGAHEAGHLLGLNHVFGANALMDNGSPADSFLLDQEFMKAPLDSEVFRIGTQDAALLLAETVGLSPGTTLRGSLNASRVNLVDDIPAIGDDLTKGDFVYCLCERCCGKRLKAALNGDFRP